MRVYVVTVGEYSDYCIEKIFLCKSKAEKYIEIYNNIRKYNSAQLEEYETYDDNISYDLKKGTKYYWQSINMETGELEHSGTDNIISNKKTIIEEEKYRSNLLTVYSSISFEHAKKVAIEKYQINSQIKLEENKL